MIKICHCEAIKEWFARSGFGFDPGQGRNLKKILSVTRRDGGAKPQSAISVPNIPGLIPSAYDVKAPVMLIVIRPSGGNVKAGGPLMLFANRRLMPAPLSGFALCNGTLL